MLRAVFFVLRHATALLVVALAFSLVFVVCTAFLLLGGVNANAIGRALESTLELLMMMDSPRHVFPNAPTHIVISGWLICVIGWLFMPLLIGAIVEAALKHTAADA